MLTDRKLSDEETDFFKMIQEEIETRVSNKVITQQKLGNFAIDQHAIEEKCKKELALEMQEPLLESFKKLVEFKDLLKYDDLELEQRIEKQLNDDVDVDISKIKHYDEIAELGNKIVIDPNDIDRVYQFGVGYYTSQDYEKAFLYFNFLCTFDSKNSQMWLLKGVIQQNLKKYQEALVAYSQAITLNQEDINVYIQIMNCLILLKDLSSAKEIYNSFTQEVDKSFYENNESIKENLELIKFMLE